MRLQLHVLRRGSLGRKRVAHGAQWWLCISTHAVGSFEMASTEALALFQDEVPTSCRFLLPMTFLPLQNLPIAASYCHQA